jgi:hypothetical protein
MNTFTRYATVIGAFVMTTVFGLQRTAFAATCKLNGEEIPCDQLADGAAKFVGFGFGLFALFSLLMLAGSIFWIMMVVHAASKPIENRAMWIVILIFTGIIGAIIYYFVVKRNFKEGVAPVAPMTPPTTPSTPPSV